MTDLRYDALELMPGTYWYCAEELPSHRLWPVGYCADKVVCFRCEGDGEDWNGNICIDCLGNCSVPVAKPCRGHETPQAAKEHWIAYLVDTAELGCVGPDMRICEAPACLHETVRFARVRDAESALCVNHMNRDVLRRLLMAEMAAVRA